MRGRMLVYVTITLALAVIRAGGVGEAAPPAQVPPAVTTTVTATITTTLDAPDDGTSGLWAKYVSADSRFTLSVPSTWKVLNLAQFDWSKVAQELSSGGAPEENIASEVERLANAAKDGMTKLIAFDPTGFGKTTVSVLLYGELPADLPLDSLGVEFEKVVQSEYPGAETRRGRIETAAGPADTLEYALTGTAPETLRNLQVLLVDANQLYVITLATASEDPELWSRLAAIAATFAWVK